jgi:hypothetical protein
MAREADFTVGRARCPPQALKRRKIGLRLIFQEFSEKNASMTRVPNVNSYQTDSL